MNENVLEIRNLRISYDAIEAVKGIDVEVPKGTIVALLGANGAGKTSTMKSISGLVPVTTGNILLNGKDIIGMEPEKIARLGIAQSPEGRQIFRELTVEENLRAGAFIVRDKRKITEGYKRVYQYFPILNERKNQIASTLSGGELQMVAIARALMSNPKVLLLDEPSLGLAPLIVRDMFHIIKRIKEEGTTIVIVEQNALQTLKIADYAYVLDLGKITMEGRATDLVNNKSLIDAYLGATN